MAILIHPVYLAQATDRYATGICRRNERIDEIER